MKLKKITSILIVIMFSFMALLSYSVYADWHYAVAVIGDVEIPIDIKVFAWVGSDQLPNDGNVGQDHKALIERIAESDYGMNNPDSFLSEYIQDRISDNKDNVSSVAPTPGGNLKDLFNTNEMKALDFFMHLHLDEQGNILECELFTFRTSTIGNKIGVHVSPVYKTDMELVGGLWKPKATYAGSADTMKYDAKQGGTRITIDPYSWIESTTQEIS